MRNITIATLVAFAAAPLDVHAETPLQRETATWNAYKHKNSIALKGLYAPTYVGLYDDGTCDMACELKNMKNSDLQSFTITGFTSRLIDSDNMLMTYTVDEKGMDGKENFSGKYHAASLWHRTDRRWLGVYHTEVRTK